MIAGNLKAAIKFPTEQFAQLARDAESGQDYAQARNYSAGAGRFNRVDPVYAGLFDPQRWNRYVYARNSPTRLVDPEGLAERCGTPESPKICAEYEYEYDDEGTRNFFFWSEWCFLTGCGHSEGGGGGGGGGTAPPGPTPPGPTPPGPTPTGPEPPGPNAPDPDGDSVQTNGLWRKTAGCAADQLGVLDLLAAGAVLAGQPIPGTKPFVVPGSSRGTSVAGMAANYLFGDFQLPARLPTIVGGPGTGRSLAIAGTKSVARFAGRAVPVVGWAVLGYDAVKIGVCIAR